MNYSNQPQISVLQMWVPPDIRPLFDMVMIAFVIFFFVGVHYRMHMAQHLIPPAYCFWLRRWVRRWLP